MSERKRDYQLSYGPGATGMTALKRELEISVRRIVVRAWQEGTLGEASPWYDTGPPGEWIRQSAEAA
jgi:hypothetical protein